MTAIYLVRHCAAAGQEPEAALTAAGREQAERLAAWFDPLPLARLVSSPFQRARDSVAPLGHRRGIAVQVDDRLAERVLAAGPLEDWRGALRESFAQPQRTWPGGESGATALSRGRAALSDAAMGEGAVALVSHGNLLSLLLEATGLGDGFAIWEGLSNPDVFRLDPNGRVVRLWAPG